MLCGRVDCLAIWLLAVIRSNASKNYDDTCDIGLINIRFTSLCNTYNDLIAILRIEGGGADAHKDRI